MRINGHKDTEVVVNQSSVFDESSRQMMIDRYNYSDEIKRIIDNENLLPVGVLARLHTNFPNSSGIMEEAKFLFNDKIHYEGLKGFREIVNRCQLLPENNRRG